MVAVWRGLVVAGRLPELEDLPRSSLWLRQVEADRQTPEAYLFEGADGLPVADYIYFTPAIALVDYCAAFQSSSRR